MHEHVFVLGSEHVHNYGAGDWWDEEEKVADAVGKLRELVERGIGTIADPTVWGLGRYIPGSSASTSRSPNSASSWPRASTPTTTSPSSSTTGAPARCWTRARTR